MQNAQEQLCGEVIATDLHCSLGPLEFSLGRCDRQALQDILQFLRGVREERVPDSPFASWKGERSYYELRGLGHGKDGDCGERGLHDGDRPSPSDEQGSGSSAGLSGGLGERSTGRQSGIAGGSESGGCNDDVHVGKESVTKGAPSGSAGYSGFRAGGAAAGAAGMDIGWLPGVPGPNLLRNRADRLRKKTIKKTREIERAREQGRREAEAEERKRRADVRVVGRVERTPEEQELHKLRVERQIIQEKRKLEKLKSPTQIIEDAMRMVDFAQKCAKQQNDSKVAAWAAALSQASAESIAKSGSMPSVESLASVKVKTVSSESSVSDGAHRKQEGSVAGGVRSAGGSRAEVVSDGLRATVRSTGYKEFVERRDNRVVVEDVDGSPLVLNKVPASKIVGSLASGTAVTTEGRSIDSNGVAYTKTTAMAWVRRYDSCIRKHASIAKSDEQIAKDAGLSLAEVKKYYRLRKEFGL